MSWAGRYPAARLVDFDTVWAERYAELAASLTRGLGADWVAEHVGSTSVPGVAAKPVIDIALRMPEGARLADASVALVGAGWSETVTVGDHWATFLVVDGVRSAIGHLFSSEQWEEAHVRLFADWLRCHRADRLRYVDLKASLVAHGMWGSGYTAAKGAFVLEVVNRARSARGLPAVTGLLLGPPRRLARDVVRQPGPVVDESFSASRHCRWSRLGWVYGRERIDSGEAPAAPGRSRVGPARDRFHRAPAVLGHAPPGYRWAV